VVTRISQTMPLLKAVVMETNAALLAAFACVFMTHTTALLRHQCFLVMVEMVSANIQTDATIAEQNRSSGTAAIGSRLAITCQVCSNNLSTIPKQIQCFVFNCLGSPNMKIAQHTVSM